MYGVVAAFSQQPPGGALPTLYAATATDVQGGDYFGPGRIFEMIGPPRRERSTPAARNTTVARRLWEVSEELTGVSYGI